MKVIIEIRNIDSFIRSSIPDEVSNAISDRMSFLIAGAEYSPLYLRGFWDGMKRIYNKKKQLFPTGLLYLVREVLNEYKLEYEIVDCRERLELGKTLKIHNLVPYDYQQDAIDLAIKKQRGIIRIGTGGGKSLVMAGVLARLNLPSLILIHRLDIFWQLIENFRKYLKVPIGRIGGGELDIQKFNVGMIQSIAYIFNRKIKLEKNEVLKYSEPVVNFIKDTNVIITDECFSASSLVLMPDMKYMRIKDICDKKIDMVMSMNLETKKLEPKKVLNWMERAHDKKWFVLVTMGEDGLLKKIQCTDTHKFYVENEYVEARKLKIGDNLTTSDGSLEKVYRKEKSIDIGRNRYNIEVEGNHNYFVSKILVSNCHHIPADSLQEIYKHGKSAVYRYGLSATPRRTDNADLLIESVLGPKFVNISASDLIKKGFLAKPTIYLFEVKHAKLAEELKYDEVYVNEVVKNVNRNMLIRDIAKKFVDKKETVLISVSRIEHGNILEALIKQVIPNTLFVHGDTDKDVRSNSLIDLKNKTVDVIIATNIFSEGVDIPSLGVYINAKAQESEIDTLQLAGRVLRKTATKDTAIIIDMYDTGCRWLSKHSKSRLQTYKTEPEFDIKNCDNINHITII